MRQLTPLSLLLRTLPSQVHSELLARLFNHLLKGQSVAEYLPELNGKCLSIVITDTRTELRFMIRDGRIARATQQAWDARIQGRLAEFWLLATRSEDPDTLFFSRRLNIEGDTETGLHIKNLLDSMDFDWRAHVQSALGPRLSRPLENLVERLQLEQRAARLLQH